MGKTGRRRRRGCARETPPPHRERAASGAGKSGPRPEGTRVSACPEGSADWEVRHPWLPPIREVTVPRHAPLAHAEPDPHECAPCCVITQIRESPNGSCLRRAANTSTVAACARGPTSLENLHGSARSTQFRASAILPGNAGKFTDSRSAHHVSTGQGVAAVAWPSASKRSAAGSSRAGRAFLRLPSGNLLLVRADPATHRGRADLPPVSGRRPAAPSRRCETCRRRASPCPTPPYTLRQSSCCTTNRSMPFDFGTANSSPQASRHQGF